MKKSEVYRRADKQRDRNTKGRLTKGYPTVTKITTRLQFSYEKQIKCRHSSKYE